MTEEQAIIIDENNQEIGLAPRSEMRAKKLWHRATSVLVFNSQGKIFIHQRSFEKDRCPGEYDLKVGGVVVEGETYEINAQRELEEELGIKGIKLEPLFVIKHIDEKNRAFNKAFKCVYDGPIKLQKEEIIHGKFISLNELKELMEKEKFISEAKIILKRYLEKYHDH